MSSIKSLEEQIKEFAVEKGSQELKEHFFKEFKEEVDNYVEERLKDLPTVVEIKKGEKVEKEVTGIFHYKFKDILTLVNNNIPVMLQGGAGSGKNHVLEQVAETLDLNFYFSNAITQEFKLTGFIDANGRYHETQFYKAFTEGGLFFLDEMDASIPEVLLILNSAIANKYFDFPNGRKQAHNDFRIVSAGNTSGTGADHIYTGRQQLDGASLDRFALIKFDYDTKLEEKLASNEDIVPFVQALRKKSEEDELPYVFSMRAIINASKLDEVMDDKFVVDSIVFKSVPIDEIELFEDVLPPLNRYTRATMQILGKELIEWGNDSEEEQGQRKGNISQIIEDLNL